MNRITALSFFLLLIVIQSCAQESSYNFSKPNEKIVLPEILHEISGLTMIDQNSFACVQDEVGTVFFYNMETKKIVRQINFEKEGDYEAITEVGDDLYILRSDGQLTKLEKYESENFKIETYDTKVPAKDNEGLCYDAANNRLLIGCKSKLDIAPENRDLRAIYGFDLKTATLSTKPVFEFDVAEMKAFAEASGIKMPYKIKKNGEKKAGSIKFNMSAIAIHPLSRKLYLISAKDHLLFVFDQNGKPEYVELLDQKLFNKAEGITFLANGDLLITNEGQDHKPTLLRFKMKEK
ncbi:hypothetical protein G3O08_09030 [Cryomorpha ignava]|uniref:SdiA-regulated family protein n=1 Tax=Cryomorpha ignava TaxID=101383 RepID=A0A7K3WQ78_9FLAO|nr:SdiA-regulated domain-containing protein [Cryomorpha ignava]NEN23644.1 hypothetical protein [Cryomorpha ignava]